MRRVSSESRAGGPADLEGDESGEQTTPEEPTYGSTRKSERSRSTWGLGTQPADHKLRTRARVKRRRRAVECHVGWLVVRGVMRTVTRSSSSKTAVGVNTKGSQQCKRSILQRVLGARNRDPIAAGDGRKADREAVTHG